MPLIAPSLLAADFSCLTGELDRIRNADMLHLDIMDGHFVPNITFGPGLVKSLRGHSDLPFDAHLMISEPDRYLEAFAQAGANLITVHAETGFHLHRTVQRIKALGLKAGVALNPATPPDVLAYLLGDLDLILVMTVNPGFGGQEFIPAMLPKIRLVRDMIKGLAKPPLLSVDGGITAANVRQVVEAGADTLVAGSSVFKTGDPAGAIENLRTAAGSHS